MVTKCSEVVLLNIVVVSVVLILLENAEIVTVNYGVVSRYFVQKEGKVENVSIGGSGDHRQFQQQSTRNDRTMPRIWTPSFGVLVDFKVSEVLWFPEMGLKYG